MSRRPGHADSGRQFQGTDHFVPLRSKTHFQHQAIPRRPGVLQILRPFEVLACLEGTACEGDVSGYRVVIAQNLVIVADGALMESLTLEIDPELQLDWKS